MDLDESEQGPLLGDFGSLLGAPSGSDAGQAPEELLTEEFDLSTGAHKAWLVKLPHFLLERWSSVQTEGQEIGRVRVYHNPKPGAPNEISVLVPDALAGPQKDDPEQSKPIPNEYKLFIQNSTSENLYCFAERRHDPTATASGSSTPTVGGTPAADPVAPAGIQTKPKKRPREPALIANVVHECNLMPDVNSPAYSAIMRQRQHLATQPSRVLEKLGGTQAEQNRLMGGAVDYTRDPRKSSLFIKSARRPGQAKDKLVRLPANEVRDMIFEAFEQYEYWSVKALKERTKQPETYLRDLLQEIAQQNPPGGPYSGLYSLLPAFKKAKVEGDSGPAESSNSKPVDSDSDDEDVQPV